MQALRPVPSRPELPPTHDVSRPDISFPLLTTDTSRIPPTDEYRQTTETGIISGQELVRQITTQNRASRIPTRASEADVERVEKLNFVTFKKEDPEDPRQWSRLYKWCKSSAFIRLHGCAQCVGDNADIYTAINNGSQTLLPW
jgi:hypothetical protein